MANESDHESARDWAKQFIALEKTAFATNIDPVKAHAANLARCYLDALARAERAEADVDAAVSIQEVTIERGQQFKRERDEARAKLADVRARVLDFVANECFHMEDCEDPGCPHPKHCNICRLRAFLATTEPGEQ